MRLGKYTDRPNSFAYLSTSKKLEARGLNSSSSSTYKNNPETTRQKPKTNTIINDNNLINLVKLPTISQSQTLSRHRTININFGEQRNVKHTLQQITKKTHQFKRQLYNTRMTTKETIDHIKYLKQQLIDNTLARNAENLRLQVNGLKKLFKVIINSNQTRSKQIRDECNRLWAQTQDIREKLFQLQVKIGHIEDSMGLEYQVGSK